MALWTSAKAAEATGGRATAPWAATVSIDQAPSWDELVARLTGRGTESADVVARRLETARAEMDLADTYDHRLVNHEVDSTANELVSLLVGPS